MCGIVGVVSQAPVNQLLYDALLLLQHRGQDAAGIATNHSSMFSMYKANGLVRDVFRTRNMRSLHGQFRHRPLPLPDRRLVQRRGSAAVLRQRAVRHHAGAQRQPDQPGTAEKRAVPQSTAATSTPIPIPKCCSTCWPTRSSSAAAAITLDPDAVFKAVAIGAPPRARRLCRGRADRRPWPAGLPRPVRHPSAVPRRQRDRGRHRIPGRQRIGGAGRPGLPLRARHRAGRGDLHRRRRQLHSAPVRRQPVAQPLRIRIRLPGASGLGDRRRLGLRDPPEDGRIPGRQDPQRDPGRGDRRRDADSRIRRARPRSSWR